jgi:hypothetical protein
LASAPVAGLGLWYFLQKEDGGKLKGTRLLVLLLVLGGIIAASLGGRSFGHYYLLMTPFAALAVAGALALLAPTLNMDKSARHGKEPVRRVIAVLFIVWLLAGALQTIEPPLRAWAKQDPGQINEFLYGENDRVRATAALVKKESPAGSRITVFGHPSIYLMTGHLPAVRDFWGNFLTGYCGHTSDLKAFAFARSDWAQDLASGKAALVVDMGGEAGERLTDYPEIAKALKGRYKLSIPLSAKVPDVLVWVPKKPVKPAQ